MEALYRKMAGSCRQVLITLLDRSVERRGRLYQMLFNQLKKKKITYSSGLYHKPKSAMAFSNIHIHMRKRRDSVLPWRTLMVPCDATTVG